MREDFAPEIETRRKLYTLVRAALHDPNIKHASIVNDKVKLDGTMYCITIVLNIVVIDGDLASEIILLKTLRIYICSYNNPRPTKFLVKIVYTSFLCKH